MANLIIANWKSNKTLEEAELWIDGFAEVGFDQSKIKVIVAPPTPFLDTARAKLPEGISVAAQDVSPFPAGSYTGAISARNLAKLADFVIVGHSERRQYFHETHRDVALKVEQALAADITPIVCVDREYITDQASALDAAALSKCVVAYEPLSAIGTGSNVSVAEVVEVSGKIKQEFGDVKVIYGGSVNWQNVSEYLMVCDGVLVGTASLELSEFSKLIAKAESR